MTTSAHPSLQKLPLLLILLLVTGCCDCGPIEKEEYSSTFSSVQVLDHSGSRPQITADSVLHSSFGLQLSYEKELIADSREKNPPEILYAAVDCYCDEIFTDPADSIRAVRIFTKKALNEEFPAESEVTALFRYLTVGGDYHPIHDIQSTALQDALNKTMTFFDWNKETTSAVSVMLVTPPDSLGIHRFTVETTYASGAISEVSSRNVVLY